MDIPSCFCPLFDRLFASDKWIIHNLLQRKFQLTKVENAKIVHIPQKFLLITEASLKALFSSFHQFPPPCFCGRQNPQELLMVRNPPKHDNQFQWISIENAQNGIKMVFYMKSVQILWLFVLIVLYSLSLYFRWLN